jgi:formate C-acetyltransferase
MKIANFESQRRELEKLYENAAYDPASGLSGEELEALCRRHTAEFPDEPVVLANAFLLKLICEKGRILPEPEHAFAGLVENSGLFRKVVRERGEREWEREFGEHRNSVSVTDFALGIGYRVDMSHITPDWASVLELGLPGLLERARNAGNAPFYRACVMVLEAAMTLAVRLGKASDNPVLLAVAEHRPETFHEALQLTCFLHDLIELGMVEVRTMGRFDRDLVRFYRHDLESGLITRESAKELLKHYWIRFYAKYQGKRFGKNFCYGPEINELSYLAFEAYYEMNIVDPKFSVFMRDDTPRDFLELCAKCVHDGRTSVVFLNYDKIVAGLIKDGREPADAADPIPIGCYEPAVFGREVSLSGATMLYLPDILLHTLRTTGDFATFDELLAAYLDDMRAQAAEMASRQARCEKIWPYINPTPLLSATYRDCIASGKDVTEGGAKYNTTGCVVSFLADCADSLAAIRELVYERKLCTLDELKAALDADWQGYEKLRLAALRQCPKWGNNDPQADTLALTVATEAAHALTKLETGRGGRITPSLYGQLVVEHGRKVGALPSGRRAGEPMSKNLDACISMDRNGLTGLLHSTLKVDVTDWPCGVCVDAMLHPSSVRGEEGIKILADLIATYIKHGGSGLQFNIFDAAMLRDAQAHPERYETLQVRVCGWNARFNDLSPESQATVIAQAEALN